MDGKRFDDVSRVLGRAVTRQGIFQVLAGLGAAGLAALTGVDSADARNGKGKGKGGHGGKKNHRGNGGNANKGKDGGGGASAEGKRKKRKGKGKKNKKNNNQTANRQAEADNKLCPDNQDKVCHCPPGLNGGSCNTTGNGGGHGDHDPLDCCCTINGVPNSECDCPDGDGIDEPCCKPAGTDCANNDQCCGNLLCCDIENSIGTCQEECCVPDTCADFEGRCGTFDDGCGGDVVCTCPSGQGCCENQCVTGGDECCVDGDCDDVICQIPDCTNGDCQYADVPDGEQGPLCRGEDEFCCNGSDCCVSPEVCTGNGCCLPKTCAGDYPGLCGPQSQGCGLPDLNCTCGGGESCCGGECINDEQCCETNDCEPRLCQNRDCVDHACDYDAVPNGDPGPLCNDPGEFCCNGNACCVQGQVCTGSGCCTPLTCRDFPGQCGTFQDTCGGQITCGCGEGEDCCGGECITEAQCCEASECQQRLCQNRACLEHECSYTPVDNGDPGPECTNDGQFCCNGNDCCEPGDVCTGQGCCTPLTCAAYPGQCGTFSDNCGSQINCFCPEGQGCCGNICVEGEQCCETEDCAQQLCQIRECVAGECDYTPVNDNQQGPLCEGDGQFCCNGNDCCLNPEICTGQGCCTPKTCAVDYPGQCGTFDQGCGLPALTCTCAEGQGCCGDQCVADDQCCESGDCDLVLCQTAACDDGTCEYTAVPDDDQGPLCDAQGEFCCGGDECCVAGQICTGEGCCTPLTCAAFPGQCGVFSDECGGEFSCGCGEGQGCCNGQCVEGEQCCVDDDCALMVCQVADCAAGDCEYTPVGDGLQGPLCDDQGEFCCNGEDCCVAGQVCLDQGCCTPQTKEEACAQAGRVCGLVSDGCGGEYDCGTCTSNTSCVAGVCLARGGKRCKGKGLAGQPCKGKKCKCKAGRRCHNRKCCEPVGDGSRHCNANSDCCPGLTCVRKYPDQHKVCMRKGARSATVTPASISTSTPGIALGAVVSGLLVKGASRLLAATGPDASIALEDLGLPTEPEV